MILPTLYFERRLEKEINKEADRIEYSILLDTRKQFLKKATYADQFSIDGVLGFHRRQVGEVREHAKRLARKRMRQLEAKTRTGIPKLWMMILGLEQRLPVPIGEDREKLLAFIAEVFDQRTARMYQAISESFVPDSQISPF